VDKQVVSPGSERMLDLAWLEVDLLVGAQKAGFVLWEICEAHSLTAECFCFLCEVSLVSVQ